MSIAAVCITPSFRSRSWTWPWRTALWARFGEPEKCHEMIRGLFQHNMLDNMITTHPPLQLDGSVKGLRARGGYTVDLIWEEGKLAAARITASVDGTCTLKYADRPAAFSSRPANRWVLRTPISAEPACILS